MVTKAAEANSKTATPGEPAAPPDGQKSAGAVPRKIPGNLPYLTASGTLKKALDRAVEASRPDKFNSDFLENVLNLKGGSARATIPILKRMGFIASDGTPTELYAKFRTQSGRGSAALQALRIGFPEIFKKSDYAHTVDDGKLRDIILEITGLKASDPVAIAIRGTFNVLKAYVPSNIDASNREDEDASGENSAQPTPPQIPNGQPIGHALTRGSELGLVYNINIVLPETSDLKVLNAIFRSIKENLMQ